MTAIQKLRELLASRPTDPNPEELQRWWRSTGLLLPQLFEDVEGLDCDLVAERAEHRRTQDARAALRVELDRAKPVYEAAKQKRLGERALDAAIEECGLCPDRSEYCPLHGDMWAAQASLDEALEVVVDVALDAGHARGPAPKPALRFMFAGEYAPIEVVAPDELRAENTRLMGLLGDAMKDIEGLKAQLDGRIQWQVSAVAHMRAWSSLFDAAVAMRENHEGCLVEPACGDCTRCRFDAAVDEAMKAVAAGSPGSIIGDAVLHDAREAARRFVALVDDLGAFVNDSDPRVMALAGPIGSAQADLWHALGLDADAESERLRADIDSRCAVCGWPLAESLKQGCVRGCCRRTPRPEHLYAPERAKREADELHERALRNGMPPSGRWA